MARPKKTDYVCDSDLSSWYKLEKYAELAKASPQRWAQLVLDRANLQLLRRDPENLDVVRTLFKKLEEDPLCELGFSYRWKSGHELDMPSVKSLTLNRMRWLLDEVAASYKDDYSPNDTNADSADLTGRIETTILPPADRDSLDRPHVNAAIDELLLPHRTVFSGTFAHLTVDLRATDAQLRSDFQDWLTKWREHANANVKGGDYSTKVLRWHQARILPYFDLRLYADLAGRRISREQFVRLLDFKDRPSPKDLLDQLSKTADHIISFDTFHALHGLSS
ncbi:MAG TPA: DUF6387 family protein [Paraburkholderia sp.]|uniref:DUF6387 family protein n=1 Tax=Paraburkholderia sp. TaxID=1926495 RepID=UPI002C5F7967|nr:DUF6387 family protein [Paraburkholderia sp.]HTR09382.1 DUF6387 family protein [Paraburkholderia sp.]